MTYYVYYNNATGDILGIGPNKIAELAGNKFTKVSDEAVKPFFEFKESTINWRVDLSDTSKIIKKENMIHFFHYENQKFYDISTVENPIPSITVTLENNVITVNTSQDKDELVFYVAAKDNPTVMLQKLVMEAGIGEKKFTIDEEDVSIFANHHYGYIVFKEI